MTQIPLVRLCELSECGFNEANMCHAAAIQVGDEERTTASRHAAVAVHPRCDTFTPRRGAHFGATDLQARVGSCKAESCKYNERFRCTAEAVIVGPHDGHADCKTYHRPG